MDEMDKKLEDEQETIEDEIEEEEKQKVFDVVFEIDGTIEKNDIRVDSASPAVIAAKKANKKLIAVQKERDKIAYTKYFLQTLVGKVMVPVGTLALMIIYVIALFATCTVWIHAVGLAANEQIWSDI